MFIHPDLLSVIQKAAAFDPDLVTGFVLIARQENADRMPVPSP